MIDQIWAALRVVPAPANEAPESLRLRRFDTGTSRRDIYGGLDGIGRPLIAIDTSNLPSGNSIGTNAIDYFRSERRSGHWWMVIRLTLDDPLLIPVFGSLCEDLASAVNECTDDARMNRVVQQRLEAWGKLFSSKPTGLLTEAEIRGLLAELIVLKELLSSNSANPLEVIQGWIGPLGGTHDFRYENSSREVKSIGARNDGVVISSLDQLVATPNLMLDVITLSSTKGVLDPESLTLNKVFRQIESIISSDPDALRLFRELISRTGYVEIPEYENRAFDFVGRSTYQVCNEFPSLTRANVPAAIEWAKYSLWLDEIEPFRINGGINDR